MKDVTEEATTVLSKIYKSESLYLKTAILLKPKKYKFGFIFPNYDLTTQKLDHVSGIQMHLAVFQAFYATVFLSIQSGHLIGNTSEQLNEAFNSMIVRENVDFIQPVKPGELAEAEFKLSLHGDVTIGKKHKFFRVNFAGFIRGEAEATSLKAA